MIRSSSRAKMEKLPRQILDEKARRDAAFESQSVELARRFKAGQISKENFEREDASIKKDFETWALSAGVYEEVSDLERLEEEEERINHMMTSHNAKRRELGLQEVIIKWPLR